jgi:hypothetical protein
MYLQVASIIIDLYGEQIIPLNLIPLHDLLAQVGRFLRQQVFWARCEIDSGERR